MWHPKIYIGNSVKSFDLIKFDHLWFYLSEQRVKYTMILTPRISCNLDFHAFPFDFHNCTMDLKNWVGASYRIAFNNPVILTNDQNGNEINGDELKINNEDRLEYDFVFKASSSPILSNSRLTIKFESSYCKH